MDEIVSLMFRGHKIIYGQIKGGLSMLVTCHEKLALMHQVLSTPSLLGELNENGSSEMLWTNAISWTPGQNPVKIRPLLTNQQVSNVLLDKVAWGDKLMGRSGNEKPENYLDRRNTIF